MPPPGENYYDDSDTPPPAAKSGADPAKDDDGEDDGGKTSILPRSFFAGKELKVGDKCDVTITAIHEDDVEVEPCDSSDEGEKDQPPEKEDAAPPEPAAAPDDGSMASMMG